MQKLGIVASEGGMSCAYSVGVILALVEEYKITKPDVVIGCSGSSNTLTYYVAGQYGSIRNIWSNLLCTKKFISFWRFWRILDIDYLIDEVFKKQDILNVRSVLNSKIKLLIAATENAKSKRVYFTNDGSVDIFESLRASSAAIGLYGKSVNIAGKEYTDGGPSASFKEMISKAKEAGAEKVIAIYNSNTDFLSKSFIRIAALFQNSKLRKTMLKYCEHPLPKADSAVLIIRPSRTLPAKTLNNNRRDVLATIQQGYEDAVAAPIEAFLS